MKILGVISSVSPADCGSMFGLLSTYPKMVSSAGNRTEVVCHHTPNSHWLKIFPLNQPALGLVKKPQISS